MAESASQLVFTQRSSDNTADTRVAITPTADSFLGTSSAGVPIVVVEGYGLSISAGVASVSASLNPHTFSANTVLADGNTAVVVRYMEIASGVTFEIGSGSDLMIYY